MATTNQQRTQCVLWYAKFESVKRVQREFRREYGVRNVPKYASIMLWYRTLDMLPLFLLPQLEEDDNMDIVFQQDGAPPHWAWEVRNFLNTTFNGMWCGRGGPTAWLPNSPDHTPPTFSCGVLLKTLSMHRNPGTLMN